MLLPMIKRAPSLFFGLLSLTLTAGCTSELELPEIPPLDAAPSIAALVSSTFDEGAQPDAIIASVGGYDITVAELALWLELYPGLTTEQALEDLLDIKRLSVVSAGSQSEFMEQIERDGEVNGLVSAWARAMVDSQNIAPTEADVERVFEAHPAIAYQRSVPELVSLLNIVFMPNGTAEADEAWLEQTINDLVRAMNAVPAHEQSQLVVDSLQALEGEIGDRGYRVRGESGLIFSEEEDLIPNWETRAARVLEEISSAAFDMEVGEARGPIQTVAGTHVIALLDRIPEEELDESAARRAAQDIATSIARRDALRPLIDGWVQATAPYRVPEVVARISADAVERLQSEEAERRRRDN